MAEIAGETRSPRQKRSRQRSPSPGEGSACCSYRVRLDLPDQAGAVAGPDPQVAAAVAVMYPRGGKRERQLAAAARDELGELFANDEFTEAFGTRGQPGLSPGQLAMVTVLQFTENLTDRQAAGAVRDKVSWKYCLGLGLGLGLGLADPGFDFTVLSQFRSRLAGHGREEKALDVLLAALKDKSLLRADSKQRTDSTHVISAVRNLNRLELAGESVRAALEMLAAAAPGWLAQAIDVSTWGRRYAAQVDSWRLPASETAHKELAIAYARDGYALLEAVYAPASPAGCVRCWRSRCCGPCWCRTMSASAARTQTRTRA